MKDEILLTLKIGKLKCFSCQKEGHGVLNCPLLHLVIRKSLFLTHTNRMSYYSEREFFNEKLKKKNEILRFFTVTRKL